MASEIVVYSISADVQWKNGILYFMSSSLRRHLEKSIRKQSRQRENKIKEIKVVVKI